MEAAMQPAVSEEKKEEPIQKKKDSITNLTTDEKASLLETRKTKKQYSHTQN